MSFVERTWITADGLRLSGRDYAGAGGLARLPVICLHGLTRNARDFEALSPWIADSGRRVLALDVRGRGRSAYAPDPMSYAVPVYVSDVVGWAEALGIARAVVVGTSMGGLIAMALAVERPDLIAAAVLNDIGPEIAPEGLARIASNIFSDRQKIEDWDQATAYARQVNAAAFPHYGEGDWEAFARRIFRDDAGHPVLDYDQAIAEPLRAAAGQPAPDLWPQFDALAADRPLLLVRGALSDLTTAQTQARMQARAPHMQVAEIDGVGHAPMLDDPQAVGALRAFLSEVD